MAKKDRLGNTKAVTINIGTGEVGHLDENGKLLKTEKADMTPRPAGGAPASGSAVPARKPGLYEPAERHEKFDWAPWAYMASGGILSYLLASDLFGSNDRDSNFLQRVAPWLAAAAGAWGGHYLSKKADYNGPTFTLPVDEDGNIDTTVIPTGKGWMYMGAGGGTLGALYSALRGLARWNYLENESASKMVDALGAEDALQKLKEKGVKFDEATRAARLAKDNYRNADDLWRASSPKSVAEKLNAQDRLASAERHLDEVSNRRFARQSWKTSNPKSYSAYLDAIEKFKEADKASAAAGAGPDAGKLLAARNKAHAEMLRLRKAAVRDRVKYMSDMKAKAVASRDAASEAFYRAARASNQDLAQFRNAMKLKAEEAARQADSLAVDGKTLRNAEKAFGSARDAVGGARYDAARRALKEVGADGKPTEAAKKLFGKLQRNAAKARPAVPGTGAATATKGFFRNKWNGFGKRPLKGGPLGLVASVLGTLGLGGGAYLIGKGMADDRSEALDILSRLNYIDPTQQSEEQK